MKNEKLSPNENNNANNNNNYNCDNEKENVIDNIDKVEGQQ